MSTSEREILLSSELKTLTLVQLLQMWGLDVAGVLRDRVKVIRHSDNNQGVRKNYRRSLEWLEEYQKYQSGPVFDNCEMIVSTVATEGTKAKFVGVYHKLAKAKRGEPEYPQLAPDDPLLALQSEIYYHLVRDTRFDRLRDRLVIEWGKAGQAWHQWLPDQDKPVIQVFPPGFVKEFTNYLDLLLTFSELRDIINNSSANTVWRDTLSAVGGVYLIVDTKKGDQYVGSASGSNGIFGRWSDYVSAGSYGHGGNERLKPIAAACREYDLQFTILNILPLANRQAILDNECLWKEKLGTRAFGLNPN